MNLNHFYHYYKSKSGGLSNLLLGSEELDQSDQGEWVRYNMNAVNANVSGVANPLSSDETVEQLDFEASTVARIAQTVTLTAGTEYTFSVWARAASGTENFRLRYWDNVGGSGGGSAFTASATWSASTGRYEMTFTAANSGTFQMFIQNAGGTAVSRRIYFWGAMLNVGGTALDYVKTEFPAGPSNPPTAPMEFGDNFAGVTAYYSLRRFTKGEDNNAIRVRRSSDDTEQDIGFDANGDLDSTALLAFVNEETTFLNDTFDGTYSYTAVLGSASVTGGVLDFPDTSNTIVFTSLTNTLKTQQVRVTFTILNYVSGDIKFENYNSGAQGTTRSANGTYVETFTIASSGNNNFGFSGTMQGQIDNFKIEQLTADGAVTTFYDQAGSNDATNATASEQPLVVSGGTLVEENGKAAINADGSNVLQTATGAIGSVSALSVFSVLKYNVTGANNDMAYGSTSSAYGAADSYFFLRQLSGNFEGKLNDATQVSSINLGTADTSQHLFSHLFVGGSKHELVKNGTSTSDTTDIPSTLNLSQELEIFSALGTTLASDMKLQELIVFDSDQSANLGTITTGGGTGIEGNINTYFDIV
jgi:hypothetical protein